MAQLVGMNCVVCDERIVDATMAEFCKNCGNPVHRDCVKTFSPIESAAGCSKCGGDPANAPPQETARRVDYAPLALVVSALVLAVGVWLFWPRGASRETAAVANSERNASKMTEAKNPIVEIETTKGTIRARMFADKAPKTVENFIELVEKKFYDGIIFHRVIKDFMIQTGCPLGTGTGGRTDKDLPAKKLKDEFHPDLRHDRPGIFSMANAGPNTGDTQIFITTVATPWLNDKHAVFGEVIEGMDVVRAIESLETGAKDRPLEPPKIISARVVTDDEQ